MRSRKLKPWQTTTVAVALVGALSGCSFHWFSSHRTADDEPTIKTLNGRSVEIDTAQKVGSNQAQAIDAYRSFLAITPAVHDAPFRAEAMRRIGDLEMSNADEAGSQKQTDPDSAQNRQFHCLL